MQKSTEALSRKEGGQQSEFYKVFFMRV